MKSLFNLICISVFCIALVSCGGHSASGPKLIDGKPEWYYSPSQDGRIGGVGVSGIHVNGKTGQKQLAVERALAEIARQMGVKVQSYSNVKSETSSGGSAVSGQSHSFFTVDGSTVTARIVEMWESKRSGELYVWMVAQ